MLQVSSSGPPCGDPTLSVYLTIEEDSTPAEIVCAKLERRLESLEQDLDTKCQVAGLKADSRDEDLHANKDANRKFLNYIEDSLSCSLFGCTCVQTFPSQHSRPSIN